MFLVFQLSNIVCKTKRIGGVSGGDKVGLAFFVAATAIPSYQIDRSVNIILEHEIDIITTGYQ